MKQAQLKAFLFLCLYFLFAILHAQKNTVAGGGEATGSGGTVSFTVGQIDYNTQSSSGIGTISEGIQQPYEIYFVGIEEESDKDLQFNLYPNPTTDKLYINFSGEVPINLTYNLFSMKGELLVQGQIISNKTEIFFEQMPASTYLLRVNDSKEIVKTFKIIKNN